MAEGIFMFVLWVTILVCMCVSVSVCVFLDKCACEGQRVFWS